MKKNVAQVVHDNLCLGCGVCQDACPKKCIKITHGRELNYPIVDNSLCIECTRCLNVCSGIGIDMKKYESIICKSENLKYDKYLGYIDNCFSGYSIDNNIRYHSASGGCLSSFLIYLLDKKIIDGAAVVGWDNNNPMSPRTYIARNRDEIIAAKSSKYCVISYEGIINEIQQNKGKYVIVGLPCHIQSFRKFCSISRIVKERIIGFFSIYCSSNRTRLSQKYLIYRYNVKKDDIYSFAYRDNGCLGSMVFKNKNDEIIKSVPYPEYWIGMRAFFNVPRCSLCIDHYGELSDISFGDLHVGNFINDKIGINSIISRSAHWTDLLLKSCNEGFLKLDYLSPEILKESQGYAIKQKKGPGVASAFKLRSIFHKKNPDYNTQLICKYTKVGLIKEIIKNIMQIIGRNKHLWFIIKILDRH